MKEVERRFMNYIGDLRKVIGHDTIMTVGCGVLVENEKNQVLLQKRSDNGQWCVPGGALELGETYKEAAARELREEVGIEVKELQLFGLYSGDDRMITYPNQDVVYSLAVIFKTDKYTGTISDEDSEVLEHRFFDPQDIPADLFAPDARAIKDWAKVKTEVVVE